MTIHYVPAKAGGRAPTPDILGAVLTGEEQNAIETKEIMDNLVWDYTQAGPKAKAVIEHTVELKRSERRITESAINAGKHLIAVKEILPHGAWGDWLKVEFHMSDSTAQNLIAIAQQFGNSQPVGNLSYSVLAMLTSKNVPETAREEVIQRAQAGETVTKATAKAVIEEHKPKPEPKVNTAAGRVTGYSVLDDYALRDAEAVTVDAEPDNGQPTHEMLVAKFTIWKWLVEQCGPADFKGMVELAEALHYQEASHPLWFKMYPKGADIDDVIWGLETCIDEAAGLVPEYKQPAGGYMPVGNLKAAVIGWLRENYPDYYGQVAALQCMIADPMHDEDVQRMEPTLPTPYRKDDLLVAMMQASAYLDSLKDDDEPEAPEPEELSGTAARRMNRLRTLKLRFQETIDLLPEFGVLTGHYVDTNPAKRALRELIEVLEGEMDALVKGVKEGAEG